MHHITVITESFITILNCQAVDIYFWRIYFKTGNSDLGEEQLASSIQQTAQPAANRQLAIRKHHWTQVFSKTPTDS